MANKKSFRKEYLNDFHKDMSGKYVYDGKYMLYGNDRQIWKKDNMILWVCCIVPAILIICVGLVRQSGLVGNPFMLAPFALSFIALFIIIWKMARLSYGGVRMRKYVHDQTVRVIPVYAMIGACLGAIAVIGMMLSLLMKMFTGSIPAAVLFAVSECSLMAGCLIINTKLKKMPWSVE